MNGSSKKKASKLKIEIILAEKEWRRLGEKEMAKMKKIMR